MTDESESNRNRKEKGEIAMSTVLFFEGTLPKKINLKDCGFPLEKPIEDSFQALYGHIGKQAGFMAAKNYADQHKLQFTIIDLKVRFDEAVNTVPVALDKLSNEEIISLKRLPRNEIAQLYEKYIGDNSDEKKAYTDLVKHPELLSSVINHNDFKDLKLMIYPAMTAVSNNPLVIGTIPHRHWDIINSAVCRLHPHTQVSLESPIKNDIDQKQDMSDQAKVDAKNRLK